MNLKEKKKSLEALMQEKIQQLQKMEENRNALTTEIIELKGKLNLLTELTLEEEPPNR